MTIAQTIEVAAAALMIGGGIWLQVRGRREDTQHGSQGAVILIVIGAILAIHGLGLFEYRPSQAEIDHAAEQGGSQ